LGVSGKVLGREKTILGREKTIPPKEKTISATPKPQFSIVNFAFSTDETPYLSAFRSFMISD